MAYYQSTFLGYPALSGGNYVYVASAGLTSVVFKAQPAEALSATATEVATGIYQWLVPDLSAPYKLYVNGNVVSNWGGSTGRFVVSNDMATINYVEDAIARRVDRAGDTLLGPYYLTYSPTGAGMDVITMSGSNVSASAVPTKGYVDLMTAGALSSLTGSLSLYMPLTGGTFTGPVTFNTTTVNAVATKCNFQSATGDWKYISVSSAIVNNGSLSVYNNLGTTPSGDMFKLYYLNTDQETVTPFRVYHDSAELPHADFSTTPLTGTGTWKLADLKIPTNATKYITGNLVNDDYAHVKWINDNFQSINSSYQSNTVIVDAKATENVTLKVYSSITGAIAGITDETGGTTSANIWSIIVKQHYNTTGYVENIEVPDWINIVGEGQVYVSGQLTRSATGTVISSKLENLNFYVNNSAQNVERFEAINCIFTSASDGDIDIERSIVRNCGFYSNNVQSSNNNKVFNCFGNQSIVWQANDKVYSYDFITGESYN